MNTQKNRLEELKTILRQHSYHYYVLNDPIISDSEYDHLIHELNAIEAEHPDWITPDSPSQRAGAEPAETLQKTEHPAPILSLANAFNTEDLIAWQTRIAKIDPAVLSADYSVEPKLDGLTVVLHYENGVFIKGATRGNGIIGEDVTLNLRTIPSIPLRIPVESNGPQPPSYLVVRGEVFINKDDFEDLNKKLEEAGQKTYVNPRNTAAGALRQLDSKNVATRPLRIFCYAIIQSDEQVPNKQTERLEYLKSLGFPVPNEIQHCQNIKCLEQAYNKWIEIRDDLPYEIDGMVVKINDIDLADSLGTVGKDPRGAIAMKFPAQEVSTKLENIGVKVGRTGVLTPFAELEPVQIGGVIVSRATLHNFDFIKEKDIRIGDRVLIKRAGDVIPYVLGPLTSNRTGVEQEYIPPQTCPECGEPIEHPQGEVAYYCVNAACPEQLIRNIEHFVARNTMDIVGLGIKIVEQLIAEKLIQSPADIYKLSKEDLINLEGFAEKKAENIIESIQKSKSQSLNRFIFSLGIRGVGEVVAQELTTHFKNITELSQATQEELENIEGIGPNIASALVDWFASPTNQKMIKEFILSGIDPQIESKDKPSLPQVLSGMSIVVTGTLQNFSRTEIKETILKYGGKPTSSVSKNTSYVLIGDNPGSKATKAEELNIPILSEQQFIDLLSSK